MTIPFRGPYIPSDTILKHSRFAQEPPTGLIAGAIAAGKLAVETSPLAEIPLAVKKLWINDFNRGPHLTFQEWRNSEWFRPGMTTSPEGIGLHNAQMNAARFDSKNELEQTLDSMPAAFLSSGSRLIGSSIGLALGNPQFALFGPIAEVTEGLLGTGSALTIRALAKAEGGRVAARTAAGRVVGGAVAGAITITPDAVGKVMSNHEFGENTTIMSAISEIGQGAALGGLIHGGLPPRRVISPASNEEAQQAAVMQSLRSKFINVGPILKNGYREERLGEETEAAKVIPDVDEAQQARTQATQASIKNLEGQQEQLENQIPEAQQKVTELAKKPLVKTGAPRGQTLIDKLNSALKPVEEVRTRAQKSLITNEAHLTEVHTASKLQNIHPSQLSDEEIDFLNRFHNPGGEKALVEERLQKAKNNQEIFRRPPAEDESPASLDRQNTQLTQADFQTKMAENRLNELNKRPVFSSGRKGAEVKLFNLRNTRNKLVDLINEHKLSLEMDEMPPDAVTQAELRTASNEIESAEGDLAFDKEGAARLAAQMETVKGTAEKVFDKQLEESFTMVEQMQKDGLLNEGLKQLFKAGQASKSDTNILTKGIEKMKDCLIKESGSEGGGESIPEPVKPKSTVPPKPPAKPKPPEVDIVTKIQNEEERKQLNFKRDKNFIFSLDRRNLGEIFSLPIKTVFSETNSTEMRTILNKTLKRRTTTDIPVFLRSPEEIPTTRRYTVEFNPKWVNGEEVPFRDKKIIHIAKTVPRSIKAITVPNERAMNSLRKNKLISDNFDFDNPQKETNRIRVLRKIK